MNEELKRSLILAILCGVAIQMFTTEISTLGMYIKANLIESLTLMFVLIIMKMLINKEKA